MCAYKELHMYIKPHNKRQHAVQLMLDSGPGSVFSIKNLRTTAVCTWLEVNNDVQSLENISWLYHVIISYPTSASGMIIIVLSKMPPKYRKLIKLKYKWKHSKSHVSLAIFVEHGIIAHIPWWLSQSKLLNCIIHWSSVW